MNDIGLDGKGGYSVGHGRGHAADHDGDGHGYDDGWGGLITDISPDQGVIA